MNRNDRLNLIFFILFPCAIHSFFQQNLLLLSLILSHLSTTLVSPYPLSHARVLPFSQGPAAATTSPTSSMLRSVAPLQRSSIAALLAHTGHAVRAAPLPQLLPCWSKCTRSKHTRPQLGQGRTKVVRNIKCSPQI